MISVGIIGGSGYTGKKLVQYCSNHSFINDFKVYGFSSTGKSLFDLFPDLNGIVKNDKVISAENLSLDHDLYFIALPHGEALKFVPSLAAEEKQIIDLGGDYRLNSAEEYEKWYGIKHTSAELLNQKIYGLADVQSTDYTEANLIANPGCYPTATLLSLLPLVEEFREEILSVSVSAYSGTSGAGKSPKTNLLMSEMDGNVAAYKLNQHRHQPEILQALQKSGFNSSFSFATHLLPVAVGIYATSFIHLNKSVNQNEIDEIYSSFYDESAFVRLRNMPPQLNWVINTNFCDIHASAKDNKIIVTTAIDNLVKGASGQAIQNLNKVYGLDEYSGILSKGVKDVSIY